MAAPDNDADPIVADASVAHDGPQNDARPDHVVLLIHGIRTQAEWAERVKEVLERDLRLHVEPPRYGYFNVLRFLLPVPFLKRRPIELTEIWINDVLAAQPRPKLSIIAHSFGSYIIGRILLKRHDLMLHRLVLCGSVLPQDFPWHTLRHRIGRVINECGWRDVWPIMATCVTWGYGAAGTFGFNLPGVKNRFHPLGHSEFLTREFAQEYWLPFISEGREVEAQAERPKTPWLLSFLTIVQAKYLSMAFLVALAAWLAFPMLAVLWPPDANDDAYMVEIAPDHVQLAPGQTLPLTVGWRDGKNAFNILEAELWRTGKPAIASVTDAGEVTANVAGGTDVVVVARLPHGSMATGRGWIEVGSIAAASGPFRREFVVVGINDTSRIEGVQNGTVGGLARVRQLRRELESGGHDVLLLHAGDFLFPSLLSRAFDGEQMIAVMNLLDGDRAGFDDRMFVNVGHHEFDRDAGVLESRIEQSQFTWLGSNIVFAADGQGRSSVTAANLETTALVEVGEVRVGLFGLTGDGTIPTYVSHIGEPIESAARLAAELRDRGADLVIAITHLTSAEDIALLQELGEQGPDLIIGGHDHEAQAHLVGGRLLRKADAEARTASIIHVRETMSGRWVFTPELRQLTGSSPSPDPYVQRIVGRWLNRYEAWYCLPGESPDCLNQTLGFTRTALIGDENSIRSVETSLGSFVADEIREAFAGSGAQAAFINAGALRLHDNIPAGSPITRRQIEELLPYRTELLLLRIDGRTLHQIVSHAVQHWPGQGHWLQVSGFAFRFDPRSGRVSELTLLAPEGPRPIDPAEELLVVTGGYLVDPSGDQDGYTMLAPGQQVAGAPEVDLMELVVDALRAAGEQGIAPQVEGRICNALAAGPCLTRSR